MTAEPTPEAIKTQRIYADMGMTDDEYSLVVGKLGRQPNYTEIGLFAVMWSEHCSYKNSKVLLSQFPTTGENVLQGPGEGAGIVDIGDELAVVFKIESHNHPSAIEPYQGAATGIGGIVRDVFSMGAKPIGLLNSLRFGELDNPRTQYLFEEVVAGIAGYGNCIGVPTVGGEIYFDDCYAGNPLVNAMCVGLIAHKDIKKGIAAGVGNSVMYVGATTGRDGIHGASFASKELDEDAEDSRPSVQAGDPFMEKLLIDACLEALQNPHIIGIQDMGAAGLISSSSEMANKGGVGIEMHLDRVPQRETHMTAYEMMLSESQERMLLVVQKGKEAEIAQLFEKYNLHAVTIGEVIEKEHIVLYLNGNLEADVPTSALVDDAPRYDKPAIEPAYFAKFQAMTQTIQPVTDPAITLQSLLAQPTIASKRWVYNQYDSMVGTNTVVRPGEGSGVLRIRGTQKALSMTVDCNSRYVYLDPQVGGQITVAEAARNLVVSGAIPLAVTDNLNFGSPDNPEIFWQMERSVKGMSHACRELNTPVIGGNVSLYNERSGKAIYPTPTVGMVGLIEHTDHIMTPGFKAPDQHIYLLGESHAEYGGSELQKMQHQGEIFGPAPRLCLETEKRHQSLVLKAIQKGLITSATDIAEGGLSVALLEGLFATPGLGATIELPQDTDATASLFGESQSRFMFTVPTQQVTAFETLLDQASFTKLGQTNSTGKLVVRQSEQLLIDTAVGELRHIWETAIPRQLEKRA